MAASKSMKRTNIVKSFAKSIMDTDIYGTIRYENMSENQIKQYMYPYLVHKYENMYIRDKKCKEKTAKKNAKERILWEGNRNTTINNMKLFGSGNRPDFVIDYDKINIAIEVKKGNKSKIVREGIGQSITYSNKFDFTICLIVDCSKDKCIVKSMNESNETKTVKDLWSNNNIYFCVV